MNFKFAALAGCSIATILAHTPASALEAYEETVDTNAHGRATQLIIPLANVDDDVLAISEETAPSLASVNALALVIPHNLEMDAIQTAALVRPVEYAITETNSEGAFGEPTLVNTMDQPATAGGAPNRRAGGGRGWLSEVRLGLLAQDQGPIVNEIESGAAINFEALFNSPEALSGIGSPRPHIGISSATDPYATSYAYAGLTWEREFNQNWFLVGGFGLAVHDGEYLRRSEQPVEERRRQKTLGCRVDFHWGVGVGRRFSQHWNAAFHYEHVSSADVCIKGALGLESIGLRVGRVF